MTQKLIIRTCTIIRYLRVAYEIGKTAVLFVDEVLPENTIVWNWRPNGDLTSWFWFCCLSLGLSDSGDPICQPQIDSKSNALSSELFRDKLWFLTVLGTAKPSILGTEKTPCFGDNETTFETFLHFLDIFISVIERR